MVWLFIYLFVGLEICHTALNVFWYKVLNLIWHIFINLVFSTAVAFPGTRQKILEPVPEYITGLKYKRS